MEYRQQGQQYISHKLQGSEECKIQGVGVQEYTIHRAKESGEHNALNAGVSDTQTSMQELGVWNLQPNVCNI